jgi:hypothetical protein
LPIFLPPTIIPQVNRRVRRGRATLEMELDGPAPAGALTTVDGRRLDFFGWTELAAAIETWRAETRLVAAAPDAASPPPPAAAD